MATLQEGKGYVKILDKDLIQLGKASGKVVLGDSGIVVQIYKNSSGKREFQFATGTEFTDGRRIGEVLTEEK
jgi:hypothetical protein